MQSNSDNTVPKVKEETDFADTSSQSYLDNAFQKSADVLEVEDEEQLIDDESDQSSDSENASNQLVVYNATSDTDQHEPVSEPVGYQPPSFPSDLTPDPPPRVLPSIGAFTVQCAICFKWRLIPTKEKYEEIREKILQQPFACEAAREWRPDISCDDPTDLSQDGSRLWAIDKPNIAQPPPGWQRLLRIRGEGSTKFADIYYAAPSGKKLRSMVEIQKYLAEHPEYNEGVNMERFSFQIPKPLQENYVRKRPARVPSSCDSTGQGISSPLEPREVNPLNWARPADNELLIGSGSLLNSCVDDSVLEPVTPPEKKRAKKSSKNLYSNTLYNRPEIQSERSSL